METNLACSSKLILAIRLRTALASVAACESKTRYPSYYVLNVPAPIPAKAESLALKRNNDRGMSRRNGNA
jgi:hypothetical protein